MPEARATIKRLSWILLLLGVVYFTFRGPIFPNGNRLWDYAVCASSSYLWVHGQDPFEWEAVKASWLERGSAPGITPDIKWLYAIVPPTTLAVLAPFAALPVAVGAYLYLLVTAALTGVATWLSGKWVGLEGGTAWRLYLAAVLMSVPATLGLFSGNPTMLATPLLLIGSYLIATGRSNSREWWGGVLVGIGVVTKVQMGLPILALWLVLGRWRACMSAALVSSAIVGIAIGRLAMADIDWLASWVENVRKMTGAGGLNDYLTAKNPDDLLNLQVGLVRLLGERWLTDRATIGIWLVLSVGLAAGMFRWRSRISGSEAFLVSTVGVLALIPVYHRTYDAIVLLPLAAMLVAGLFRRPGWILGWVGLGLMASLLVPAGLPNYLVRRGIVPPVDEYGIVASIIYGHKGWCMLGLAVVLVAAYGLGRIRLGSPANAADRERVP